MARALNGRSNLYNAAARAKARKASLIDTTRMRQLVQQGTESIGLALERWVTEQRWTSTDHE